ncbi:filamentous hemagglutinin N-terminal domain-containing protein, partial [Prochlorococcus sp. AH-736-E05]|nr:filamentous hemagglutinin N-terminal domain-containing protein [Prochlorococcus sp. AH-736-E05]
MRNRDIKNKSNFNSIPRDGDKYNLISNWKKLYAKKPKFSASVPAAAAAIVASFGPTLPVFALPEGLTVKQGNLTTETTDNTLTINQGTNRAFGDWNSFDIQSNETVNINQPTVDSIMVGRITGGSRTEIFGNLNATGGVILINPKGMLFGAEAEINTASFSASTLDLEPLQFSNANDVTLSNFDTNSLDSSIINFGAISVNDTGLVSLIAPQVVNEGIISAKLGKVQLASGTSATLDLSGDGLLNIALDEKATGIIKNTGTIEGQNIRIGGGVASSFVNSTVNIDGFVQATGFDQDSSVDVQSSGDIYVDGTITSSEANTINNGGSIKILGDRIALKDSAKVSTSGANGGGEILIGGNKLGLGPEPNASTTVILEGAEITADALDSGDGGRVIVWSDDYTNFSGSITAKGTLDGSGGFVETSSLNNIQLFGTVDASGGTIGEWLIDPSNVTVTDTNSQTFGNLFEPSADSATVAASSIISALASQNVTIDTHNPSGSDVGTITITDALTGINANGTALILVASEDVVINNSISSSGGALSISINAQGNVKVQNNADITTKGGFFKVAGSNDDGDSSFFADKATEAGSFLLQTGSDITTTGANDAVGGVVTIKTKVRSNASLASETTGDITINGNIITSGGTATSGNAGKAGGAVTLHAGVSGTNGQIIIGSGGNITTTGSNAQSGNGGAGGAVELDTNGESITLTDASISTGGGTGTGTAGSGGNIDILDPLLITSDIANEANTLDTGSSVGGTVTITKSIDGVSGGEDDHLDIISGTGTVTINGTSGGIGVNQALTTLDINAAAGQTAAITIANIGAGSAGVSGVTTLGNTNTTSLTTGNTLNFGGGFTYAGDYDKTQQTFTTSGGNASFLGNVTINGDFSIDSTGGDITITGNVIGTNVTDTFTLTDGTGTGTITVGGNIGAAAGSTSKIKSVTLVGDTAVKLSGDITTSSTAGAISITGPVTLEGDVTIDADAAATTVTFASTATVNSDSTAGGRDFEVNTSTGDLKMQG